jgi:hypothetical protein
MKTQSEGPDSSKEKNGFVDKNAGSGNDSVV